MSSPLKSSVPKILYVIPLELSGTEDTSFSQYCIDDNLSYRSQLYSMFGICLLLQRDRRGLLISCNCSQKTKFPNLWSTGSNMLFEFAFVCRHPSIVIGTFFVFVGSHN
jgi:hypothetical protein